MRAIIHPATRPLGGHITAQASKNYTSRYLLAAALAEGTSVIRNVAISEDSHVMQRAIAQLGAHVLRIDAGTDTCDLEITGFGGSPRLANNEPINAGNAGAVLRFLLGVGVLLPEVEFVTDRPDSLGKRPNQDLLDALQQFGCHCESRGGMLPIRLRRQELHGGHVTVSGAKSSQYLSALLFLAPLVGEPVWITVTGGLVSRPPVRQTLEVLHAFGVEIEASSDLLNLKVQPQVYRGVRTGVNGDWPGTAALAAAVAVTHGEATIGGLFDDAQGEKACIDVLTEMGAHATLGKNVQSDPVLTVRGSDLIGVDFDGDLATDAVLALAGAACFARGRTSFFNVANLRLKECDRITEPIEELRKLGVQCWEGHEIGSMDPDSIVIEGNPQGYEGGVTVDGRRDHRVIMLLTIVGLGCRKPITITGAEHIAKSYPDFFTHMRQLGAKIDLEDDAS